MSDIEAERPACSPACSPARTPASGRRRARATLAGRIAVGLGLMIALSGCIIEPYHPYYRPHPYYYGY